MSKAKVDWAFQELITSAKLDEMVIDDLTPGRLIIHSTYSCPVSTAFQLGWYLYNPAKQTNDRMRIFGAFDAPLGLGLRYTLDSGATAITLGAGTDSGVDVTIGDGSSSATQRDALYWDVDLSGIASTQYIGVIVDNGITFVGRWNLAVFLYRASDTPF